MALHDSNGRPNPGAEAAAGGEGAGPALPAALARFLSCRWRRPAPGGGGLDCCGHRDVLSIAGVTGFSAEAWCLDCRLYKARRRPRRSSHGG